SDVSRLSDEQTLALRKGAPKLLLDYSVFQLTPVHLLDCQITLTKMLLMPWTLKLLPGIRKDGHSCCAPLPRRETNVGLHDFHELYQGSEVLSGLSAWHNIDIISALPRYVHPLRRLQVPPAITADPLSPHHPKICQSPIFCKVRSHSRPFASYEVTLEFCITRHRRELDRDDVPEYEPLREELFDNWAVLVLICLISAPQHDLSLVTILEPGYSQGQDIECIGLNT
ncbi:hypothetical protein OBBRIDRAFT_872606, partial [Obba rivulosa]